MTKEKILLEMQRKRQEDQAFPNLAESASVNGHQLLLKVDESDAFDYERAENTSFSKKEIKAMIINEITLLNRIRRS